MRDDGVFYDCIKFRIERVVVAFVSWIFHLILMLASATSTWEKRLDLKVYVFLMTIPWRCFICGSFLLLMCRVCHAILSSFYCSLVVTCLKRADLLALLYMVIYCVLSLPDGVSWVKCGT